MLTTIVDHNDIRLRPMESDGGKPCSQVNDSSRQGAGSLQAKDHESSADGSGTAPKCSNQAKHRRQPNLPDGKARSGHCGHQYERHCAELRRYAVGVSLLVATWVNAAATVGLLVGAAVTAIFAVRGFRKQSEQLKNQQETNRLQALEIQSSLDERKREASERRRAQAIHVFLSEEDARRALSKVHVWNFSDQPSYKTEVGWQRGDNYVGQPICLGTLMPGDKRDCELKKPRADKSGELRVTLTFHDANKVVWVRDLQGGLAPQVVRRSDLEPSTGVRNLFSATDAAPSILNTKPWLFDKVADDRIELRPNWQRQLKVIDPRHRQLVISCGAALFNLRLAIRVTGHDLVVWLLPEASGSAVCPHCGERCGVGDLLATVQIAPNIVPPKLTEQELYETIPLLDVGQVAFTDRPVPTPVLVALEFSAAQEGARLRLLRRHQVRQWLRYTESAEQALATDPRYLSELRQWTDEESAAGAVVGTWSERIRSVGHDSWVRRFERRPELMALSTDGDGPLDWLRAGQALQRTLLTATRFGLRTFFLNEPIMLNDLKKPSQSNLLGRRFPEFTQIVMGLSYAQDSRARAGPYSGEPLTIWTTGR